MKNDYLIEMNNITKIFPGIVANDNITLKIKKGEIHALLGENGAGKSTLVSVLFGLYQPEEGEIRKNGELINIKNPNDANNYGIGMVHQHFKLVEIFTVLENIILGVEPNNYGFINKKEALEKINILSQKYGLHIDPNAYIEDISVGMQQRVEILKMLYRDNEILIFDEPTAVLTPQEIRDFMNIMKNFAAEGKSILFITHKLNEIKEVADRCTILRKGKYIDTVDVSNVSVEELSRMMVGRDISFDIQKKPTENDEVILEVRNLSVASKTSKKLAVNHVSFDVKAGEILCIAGIEGNGQSELVYGITGIEPLNEGKIYLKGMDVTHKTIREKSKLGFSHIPEDRHKHGLVLDYTLEDNLILQKYWDKDFQNRGFLNRSKIRNYAESLIAQYDIRSGQGPISITRNISGGNQQKAIVAREVDKSPELLIAVQPTRGLDVGAIEYIHNQLIAQRDSGKAVLLVSLELDEVMKLSDRILVIYEGEIVGNLDSKTTNVEEIGLYMSGAKRQSKKEVLSYE